VKLAMKGEGLAWMMLSNVSVRGGVWNSHNPNCSGRLSCGKLRLEFAF